MARVKRGVQHAKRRRYLLKKTKGFRWGRKKLITRAKTAATRAGVFAYRDRRTKKRLARQLWTVRLNAAVREHGMSYSRFIDALKKSNIALDRKVLSTLALEQPKVFEKILAAVKKV